LKSTSGNKAKAPERNTVSDSIPDILKTIAVNVNPTIKKINIPKFQINSFLTVQRSDSNIFGNNPGRISVLKKKVAALTIPISKTKYPSLGEARKFIPKG
jgi:hypothetical protein